MTTELAVTTTQSNAVTFHRAATDAAEVVREFVLKRTVRIGDKDYITVEGWQAIANCVGLVASSKDVESVTGGIRAIGELRNLADGRLISTAEGFVGDDEPVWYGGGSNKYGKPHIKRPLFAIRAMAQTRAISRVCRTSLAFVALLVDAGLSTTPAEEMEGVVDVDPAPKRASIPAPTPTPRPSVSQPSAEGNLVFTDRLIDISERQGQSAKGPWSAWFLKFENREESIGTFSQTLGDAAQIIQGNFAKVTARPGRKQGQWELLSIEPAPDDVPM